MNFIIYSLTGVPRPSVAPGGLRDLAEQFDTLHHLAGSCTQDVTEAINHVLANNEGDAATAFKEASSGSSSSLSQLAELERGALRTRDAHADAAVEVETAQTEMDAIANQAARDLDSLKLLVPILAQIHYYKVVSQAQRNLLAASQAASHRLEAIYDLGSLPEVPPETRGTHYGTVSPEIEELWDSLSVEDRKGLVEAMAASITEDWDAEDRPTVVFFSTDENRPDGVLFDPEKFSSGLSGRANPSENIVYLNYDKLASGQPPNLLHTVVHEHRHMEQFRMMDELDELVSKDPDFVAKVRRGEVPDPFLAEGATTAQIERFDVPYPDVGKLTPEEWTIYRHHPWELDARNSGTWEMDNLTVEDLEELLPR